MRCCWKSDLPGHVLKGAIALIEVDEIVGDARRHHLKTIRAFLADEVVALTFQQKPTSGGGSIKWIQQSSLDLPRHRPVLTQRERLIEEWTVFLTGFSEVEDVRFKVTDSTFLKKAAGNFADSKIKFFLVGRDEAGNRSWVKGSGRLQAQQEEGSWEISLMVFDQIEFLKAEVDLFSEPAFPTSAFSFLC